MCILFFALQQHPQFPVIICANRDEMHQRPTKALHFWPEEKIYAGKDLQAGGTWLGITPEGRFSALTNFRQGRKKANNEKSQSKNSRGELVLNALKYSDKTLKESLPQISHHYEGFNLVFGQLNHLHCFDNIEKKWRVLSSGVHSLSNGALDDIWPKMALGQQNLMNTIKSSNTLNINDLFDLMKNTDKANTQHLPNTGISKEREKFLSSIFITSPEYGTRTTTIITQDVSGEITIHDRTYNPLGEKTLEISLCLNND